MRSPTYAEHGNRCSCRVLASSLGCNPKAIRMGYCLAVLMKHWAIECNHGCHNLVVEPKRGSKWRGVGRVDSLMAILIRNT